MTTFARRVVPAAGALLVYAAAVPWVFRSWFLSRDLIPHTPGPIGALIDADLYLNIWILAWIAHAAVSAPASLLDGNIFHPALNTIAGSENMFAHLPFTAPVLAYSESALTMLKAYVLESFALSGLGMFLYVRHHTGNAWAALVAGAAFTFTPFRAETIPQPQYLGMAFLPLTLLAIDLHLETGRWRWLAGLAAALILQALSCVYIGYFTFILSPIYVLARLFRHERLLKFAWIRPATRLAGAMGVAALVLVPVALPYLQARDQGMIPSHGLDFIQIAAWPPWRFFSGEFIWRAGIVAVALVGLDLTLRVAHRFGLYSTGESKDVADPASTSALWILAASAAVLAAGPSIPLADNILVPLPYRALYEWVPGFSSIRVPIRFVIIVSAAFAALSGFAFARFLRDPTAVRTGAAALVLTATAIFATTPHPRAVMAAHLDGPDAGVYHWLAEQPGTGAILEIPGQVTEQDMKGNLRNGRYMLASSLHWRPLLNGYTAYPPPSAPFYSAAIRDLPERTALANLVDASDLRWIVLHRDELTAQNSAPWPTTTLPGLRRVARFGADEVYEVTLERKRDWRDQIQTRMTSEAADTLEGTPTSPLAKECRKGKILGAVTPRQLAPFPLARRVPVTFRNESDCTWPATGLLAKGLVGIDYRWIPPAGAPTQDQYPVALSRLIADVPPHTEASSTLMLSPPRGAPGSWTLEIRLAQEGSREPIATLRKPIEIRTPRQGKGKRSAADASPAAAGPPPASQLQ